MVLLHIRARERPSTASADSLNLSQMDLVHMPSVAILIDNSRASGPCAVHSLLAALCDGNMPLLGAAG
jgi:hypothetical protein